MNSIHWNGSAWWVDPARWINDHDDIHRPTEQEALGRIRRQASQRRRPLLRVIVTLEDDDGRVVGYRVSRVADALPAGESVPLRLAIVAQTALDDARVVITVEARRAG